MGESDIIFMGSSTVTGHRRYSYNTAAVFRNALSAEQISFVNSPVFRNKNFRVMTEVGLDIVTRDRSVNR